MRELIRLAALLGIFLFASAAWLALGGVMTARTSEQESGLYGSVADLWGTPLHQRAPTLSFEWQVPVDKEESVFGEDGAVLRDAEGDPIKRTVRVLETRSREVQLDRSDLHADLRLDQRRKGLMWFALYDVDFDGSWSYVHDGPEAGVLWIRFDFPVTEGVYDDFRFAVDGADEADEVVPANGFARVPVRVEPGQEVGFEVGYRSRGLDEWTYRPTQGVGQLEDFALAMTTDFADIDFPSFTMSPSSKARTDAGWALEWRFSRLVTGHGMGMVMPERVQPGPLAASMSFSAPLSLGLFMLWIYVLGLLKGLDIHPMNHLFVAGAFFAFHLLFGYTADHLPVEWAFGLSAVVSVFLVITYLRLAVGPRFALVEAGLAQLLYLVGFSLAHFWDGFTGLTVTVLGVVTLFALMQLTGRLDWSEVFAPRPAPRPETA